jgi:hypothetical protein
MMPAGGGAAAGGAPRSPVLGEDAPMPSGAELAAMFAGSAAAQDAEAAVGLGLDHQGSDAMDAAVAAPAAPPAAAPGGRGRGRGGAAPRRSVEQVLQELHSQVGGVLDSGCAVCHVRIGWVLCCMHSVWVVGEAVGSGWCAGRLINIGGRLDHWGCVLVKRQCGVVDGLAGAAAALCSLRWSMSRRHTLPLARRSRSCWPLWTSETSTGSLASLLRMTRCALSARLSVVW